MLNSPSQLLWSKQTHSNQQRGNKPHTHTALMQVPGHVAMCQSTRHHGWAPPALTTAANGTHSRHSHKASRQHCQTVRAIHIDRRQHLELAWKRQQERDGESTLPAWHDEDGQGPAAAQLIAPSCSSCRAAEAGCCVRQGDGDPGPAAPGGSCGQGGQLAAGGVLLHALLWGLQGAAAGLHLSVRGGEQQQDNMQHASQPAWGALAPC